MDSSFTAAQEVHELLQSACQELGYPCEEARPLADWITAEHWITAVAQLEGLTEMQWSRLNLPVALEATVQRMVADRSALGTSSLRQRSGNFAAAVNRPQVSSMPSASFNVRGRRFRVFRHLVAKHADAFLAKLLLENMNDPDRTIYVDADPDMFRWVLVWYNHGAPVRVPGSIKVPQLRREFEALGIRLGDEDIVQEGKTSAGAEQAEVLAEQVKALRLRLSAVQLARAVAATLAHRDFSLGAGSSPIALTIRPLDPEDDTQGEWLLENERIMGLSEAGLTANFDWVEVQRHACFQEALKQQGLMCVGCRRVELSVFELTVMPL